MPACRVRIRYRSYPIALHPRAHVSGAILGNSHGHIQQAQIRCNSNGLTPGEEPLQGRPGHECRFLVESRPQRQRFIRHGRGMIAGSPGRDSSWARFQPANAERICGGSAWISVKAAL